MPVEIERKFLVNGNSWRNGHGIRICQGYLNRDKERTVRVRLSGEKAFLTIKSVNIGTLPFVHHFPQNLMKYVNILTHLNQFLHRPK